jgi:hypothetical protein
MVPSWVSRAVCLVAVCLAACGGGETAGDAQALRATPQRAAASPAAAIDADTLMDWAEGRYPQFFPGHQTSGSYLDYRYRAYDAGNGQTAYLGITTAGRVDVWVPGLFDGNLTTVGTLADFVCQVRVCGSVSGTAAAGAPIAGMTVTLKDSASHTVTTTTSITGTYNLDTTGLTGPFLLQVSTAGGQRLYGVTADPAATNVANLTQLTDLIVRSWYAVQGATADTAFANPGAAPPPSQQQTAFIADAVLSLVQRALTGAGAGVSTPLDLLTKPFSADHTGIDAVLDQTSISYGTGATLNIAGADVQQTSLIGFDPVAGGITATSTTAGGGNTSTSAISVIVPVQPAQADATSEISALMNRFAALITLRGPALTSADLASYLDPDLLDEGANRDQFAAALVQGYTRGQTMAMQVQAIKSLDLSAGLAEVAFLNTESLDGQSSTEKLTFFFRKLAGGWTISGDRRIAEVGVDAEAHIDQGAYTQASHPSVSVDVRPLQNTIGSVTAGSGSGSIAMTRGSTVVDDAGVLRDSFYGAVDVGSGALPAAGTIYTVTLNPLQGSPVSYAIPLNAFTTETAPITSPTGSSLADANLGRSLGVSWRLPTTYAVQHIGLLAIVSTGIQSDPSTYTCYSPEAIVGATATSGTLDIPSTCAGLPVVIVNINLTVKGVNGERSQTIHMLR